MLDEVRSILLTIQDATNQELQAIRVVKEVVDCILSLLITFNFAEPRLDQFLENLVHIFLQLDRLHVKYRLRLDESWNLKVTSRDELK